MKKIYETPVVDVVKFSSSDETSAALLISGNFSMQNNAVEIPEGIGRNTASKVLDF